MITLVLKLSVNFYGDLKDQKFAIVVFYFIPFVIYTSFHFFLTTALLGEKYNAPCQEHILSQYERDKPILPADIFEKSQCSD